MEKVYLMDASSHPPALDAVDEEEIPWVLLEDLAYVADLRNATTAFSDCSSGCDGMVQASLFVARPPRVSYICVFYHRRRPAAAAGEAEEEKEEKEEQMIRIEPQVCATDGSLVLLRIVLGDPDHNDNDWFVYQPGGDCGPLLTRLERTPGNRTFDASDVALVSCCHQDDDDDDGKLKLNCYMVAAFCDDIYSLGKGRFILYLYHSKHRTWTASYVSVEDQHLLKYQDDGIFFHINTKTIVAGGENATIAFVDLYRGMLLCDLAQIKDKPWLRYVPLPHPEPATAPRDEPRFSRDIAVVDGHFNYVRELIRVRPYQFRDRRYETKVGWTCEMFTRPVFASSDDDDSYWEPVCSMDSSKMVDIEGSNPAFQLLPRLKDDEGRPLPLFQGITVSKPMLSLDNSSDNTICCCCFMVRNWDDGKAWVMDVDMKNNTLRGVNEFDMTRYTRVGIAYKHSRISRYLKRA